MITKGVKRADSFLRKRCDKIPASWRKGVLIAMFATLVAVAIFNFLIDTVL